MRLFFALIFRIYYEADVILQAFNEVFLAKRVFGSALRDTVNVERLIHFVMFDDHKPIPGRAGNSFDATEHFGGKRSL